MLMPERQNQIIEILQDRQTVTVAELSEMLDVSSVTVRSDLRQLADQGRIQRTHGGATLSGERARQEYTFAARQQLHAARKQAIGELAATLVSPMESILLDASTTSLAVGTAIKRQPDLVDLTVVCTGVWTAMEMLGFPNINVMLAGGHLRTTTGSITGSIAHEMLRNFHIQKAFLGAWGLSLNEGLTDTNLQEVELKRCIVDRSHEVIAVVDGSKFGQIGLASFASAHKLTHIVTDDSAPPDQIQAFRDEGIEVLVAQT
ncbi:MAG: DeoR/GlpR transcriptional regulator [Ardenticatenaceae bacterium]|nr:DeoR/GlpR transcriptional regulator [Anaerolineales bacterium]MCB8922169.1 DeoR/GlpR transcriptional regulator [Ardenticatenaceae bacterium]MCB8991150.1 DeoR/GlpR transcriptional regulator [Ardenticatenaceae bacterium]